MDNILLLYPNTPAFDETSGTSDPAPYDTQYPPRQGGPGYRVRSLGNGKAILLGGAVGLLNQRKPESLRAGAPAYTHFRSLDT